MKTMGEELIDIVIEEGKHCTHDYIVWVVETQTAYPYGSWAVIKRQFREHVRSLN